MYIELYGLFIDKYNNSIYSKRINKPKEILINGKERFESLGLNEQVNSLLSILDTYGRNSSGGVDLSKIGGASKAAATVSFSATISNWKNVYTDVRLIDISPSGIWEKQSDNLLDLL